MDTGCAARLIRVVYARKEAMLMGRKIVCFLMILLAVLVLLAYISPKAM